MEASSTQNKAIGPGHFHKDYNARGQSEKTQHRQTVSDQFDRLAENLEYVDEAHQPKVHSRTYIALLALCLQSFCQLWSLLGPTAVVRQLPRSASIPIDMKDCLLLTTDNILLLSAQHDCCTISRRPCEPGMGSHCTRHPSRRILQCPLSVFGPVSSPQDSDGSMHGDRIHRIRHCTERSDHRSTHRRSNSDWSCQCMRAPDIYGTQ